MLTEKYIILKHFNLQQLISIAKSINSVNTYNLDWETLIYSKYCNPIIKTFWDIVEGNSA